MRAVKEWRRCWRMFSVQAMALAGVIEAAWLALPAEMKASVSDEWRTFITIALMILGIVGRLVVQEKISGGGND